MDSSNLVRGLVMEYVRGVSLDRRLEEREKLPYAEVVELGYAVASALEAVHKVGLVHRDLKPANVIVSEGVYKLIDFGIASADEPAKKTARPSRKVVLDDLPLEVAATKASMLAPSTLGGVHAQDGDNPFAALAGTLGYMDPRCVSAQERATPASDLYALGATLFECAAGLLPATYAAKVSGAFGLKGEIIDGRMPAPSLAQAAPDAPPGLVAIVDQLLDPDPARRPSSAGAVVSQLAQVRAPATAVPTTVVLSEPPVAASQATTDLAFGESAPAAVSPARRRVWVTAGLGGGVACAAAVALVMGVHTGGPPATAAMTLDTIPPASATAIAAAPPAPLPVIAASEPTASSHVSPTVHPAAAKPVAPGPSTRALPSSPSRPPAPPSPRLPSPRRPRRRLVASWFSRRTEDGGGAAPGPHGAERAACSLRCNSTQQRPALVPRPPRRVLRAGGEALPRLPVRAPLLVGRAQDQPGLCVARVGVDGVLGRLDGLRRVAAIEGVLGGLLGLARFGRVGCGGGFGRRRGAFVGGLGGGLRLRGVDGFDGGGGIEVRGLGRGRRGIGCDDGLFNRSRSSHGCGDPRRRGRAGEGGAAGRDGHGGMDLRACVLDPGSRPRSPLRHGRRRPRRS